MHPRTAPARLPAIRRPLVWLIVLALVAYGHSALLVQLLGPAHRHEANPSGPWAGLVERFAGAFGDIRAWRAELHARLLPSEKAHAHANGVVHVHDHTTYQRHHHDPRDGSVVAIGALSGEAVADAASQASAGSATLPLAPAPHWRLPAAGARSRAWPAQPPERWSDADVVRSERPPRG